MQQLRSALIGTTTSHRLRLPVRQQEVFFPRCMALTLLVLLTSLLFRRLFFSYPIPSSVRRMTFQLVLPPMLCPAVRISSAACRLEIAFGQWTFRDAATCFSSVVGTQRLSHFIFGFLPPSGRTRRQDFIFPDAFPM